MKKIPLPPKLINQDRYAVHQWLAGFYPDIRLYWIDRENCLISVRTKDDNPPKCGIYGFSLEANPTKRDIRTAQRVPADDSREWLGRQAEKYGFELIAFQVDWARNETFVRKGEYGTLWIVSFFGIIVIRNAKKLKDAFCNGIGSAKAFGCGMIEVFNASA